MRAQVDRVPPELQFLPDTAGKHAFTCEVGLQAPRLPRR